jgi:hypothetical protein
MQVWDGSQQHCGQFGDLTACMEAARERQLPPVYERDLVMLHTMKPHFDAVKQGEPLAAVSGCGEDQQNRCFCVCLGSQAQAHSMASCFGWEFH